MKTISLWQPWATLYVTGEKHNETRGWPTLHRGWLLIHAAKHFTRDMRDLCATEPFYGSLAKFGYVAATLPLGALVGAVHLAECFRIDAHTERRITKQECAYGDYTPGRYGWTADKFLYLQHPIPWRGAQGFFDIDLFLDETDRVLYDDGGRVYPLNEPPKFQEHVANV